MSRGRKVLLGILCYVALVVVAAPAVATVERPVDVQGVGQIDGDPEIPPGCPGGPEGLPDPGIQCPDAESAQVTEVPPPGCPGGPEGLADPSIECPDGSTLAPPLDPVPGCFGSQPGEPEPGDRCADGSVPRDPELDDQLSDWLDLDGVSEHDLANYDIGCDEGDAAAFMRKVWCSVQAMPFALAKWVVGIGINIMDWALEFEVAETLTPVAGVLSRLYENSLVGPVNLVHLAWLVTLFVGGWSLMSGRAARGFREIFTTFLIAILGGMVLANPDGYLGGAQDLARNSSGMVLQAVDGAMTDDGTADATEVRNRLSGILQRAFVDEPYDLINWGEPLRGECAQARNQILSEGPHGSDDRPREIMRQHGCDDRAAFNAEPSDNRAVGSITVALAAILITLLLITLALAVFTAQITLVILFSAASLVWVVALFPGGRGLLWMWLSRLVWAVLITVTAMFLLSWVAITTTVLLDNTSDISIIQRSVMVIVLAAVAYKFRGTIDRGLEGAGAKMAAMMGGAASGSPAAAPDAPARGASGMAVSPVTLTAAVGLTALHGAQRVRKGGQQAANLTGTAARASGATNQGLRTVGSRAADAGRSVVMAPVLLPQRIGQRQAERQQRQGTSRSVQARDRLDRARQSRRQWRQNAAHPLRATRQARESAERGRRSDPYDWM